MTIPPELVDEFIDRLRHMIEGGVHYLSVNVLPSDGQMLGMSVQSKAYADAQVVIGLMNMGREDMYRA